MRGSIVIYRRVTNRCGDDQYSIVAVAESPDAAVPMIAVAAKAIYGAYRPNHLCHTDKQITYEHRKGDRLGADL